MLNVQFDIKRIHILKELLLRLRHGGSSEKIQSDFEQYFKQVSVVDVWLIQLELLNGDYGITIEDVKRFSSIHPDLYGSITNVTETFDIYHPVQIYKEENTACQIVLNQINRLLESMEENQPLETDRLDELRHLLFRLGEFHNHYNRKEKLFFPIMERYGHYSPIRTVWLVDDQIRVLYQAAKRQIVQLPDGDFARFRKRYDAFETKFKEMIFQEEAILLPILQSIFSEDDWLAIASESDAFGYTMIEAPIERWAPKSVDVDKATTEPSTTQDVVFGGGGYLTTEEATLIFNNLPLEITFVDKNDLFKYFNEMTEASEMMLVRTPISIGRNVANCHPPKSLKKVMTLIRDLKTGKRTSESMWFKKNDQYIHLTYKAISNEAGEFLGVLEYVQDIQPFFELPSKVKTGLSVLEE